MYERYSQNTFFVRGIKIRKFKRTFTFVIAFRFTFAFMFSFIFFKPSHNLPEGHRLLGRVPPGKSQRLNPENHILPFWGFLCNLIINWNCFKNLIAINRASTKIVHC